MLAHLQKPVVPLAVQSVLANNSNAAESTNTSPRGGAPLSKSRGRGAAIDSNSNISNEKSEWDVPALGHAKITNKAEVYLLCNKNSFNSFFIIFDPLHFLS